MDEHKVEKNPRHQPHILVADDTDVNQKLAQLILQKADYRVDVAANGRQAVESYQRDQHDLILMDIQMPIMDGHEATKRIRKWECGLRKHTQNNSDPNSNFRSPNVDFNEVPIIAMSGNATAGRFDEILYPGMSDCIGKPLKPDLLLTVVRKWIHAGSKTQTHRILVNDAAAADKRSEENQFPLDLQRAVQEFLGRKDILAGVLHAFINSAGTKIDNLRRAVKVSDYSLIVSEAHAIKGAAANLTADKLARLAADLEQAAEQEQQDLTGELTDKLDREIHCLDNYVRQHPEIKNKSDLNA